MVWQKRGARDSIPYRLTLALGLTGVGYGVILIGIMSYPGLSKKAE